jgi:hypothetical protein
MNQVTCYRRVIESPTTWTLFFTAVLLNSLGICSAQQATVTVSGVAQIALAGALAAILFT